MNNFDILADLMFHVRDLHVVNAEVAETETDYFGSTLTFSIVVDGTLPEARRIFCSMVADYNIEKKNVVSARYNGCMAGATREEARPCTKFVIVMADESRTKEEAKPGVPVPNPGLELEKDL